MSGLGQPQMAPVLQSSPTARPMGQPLGYARVSTTDQRPDSQADALTAGTDTPPGRDLFVTPPPCGLTPRAESAQQAPPRRHPRGMWLLEGGIGNV